MLASALPHRRRPFRRLRLTPRLLMAVGIAAMTASVLLSLGGCGNTGADYAPILDGPTDPAAYKADLSACQTLARERGYWNDDVLNDGLMAGAVGAVVGALSDQAAGGVAGAAIGGLVGAGGRAWETMDERKSIVRDCLKGRGYRVVGSVPSTTRLV